MVDVEEEGYNKIFDCFCIDKASSFVRVITVNPLHEEFLRLILVGNRTSDCFNSV